MNAKKTYDSTYANMIIEKYEKAIWLRLRDKLPEFRGSEPYIHEADREDVFSNVVCAWLDMVATGKFKGEHGEPSAVACIYGIIEREGNKFFRKRKIEGKYVEHEPKHDNEEEERDPWIDTLTYHEEKIDFSPEERCEAEEQVRLILSKSKIPHILKLKLEGYSTKEIAEMIGEPYEQVKKKIQRDKKNIVGFGGL